MSRGWIEAHRSQELGTMLALSGKGNFEPVHRLSELPCGQDRPGNGSWFSTTLALRPFLGEVR